MVFVLGMEALRVTVFVSGLVIFFANATTLTFDASISSKVGDLVFIDGLDVSLISLFPLHCFTRTFKFFNDTFGYA